MLKTILSAVLAFSFLSFPAGASNHVHLESPVTGHVREANGLLERFFRAHPTYPSVAAEIVQLKTEHPRLVAIASERKASLQKQAGDTILQINLYRRSSS